MSKPRTYKNLPCAIEGCGRNGGYRRGWCRVHYDRWLRHGDPIFVKFRMSPHGAPMAWLEEHKNWQRDDCLVWPFARFPDGRAHMNGGKPSRAMCELVHGPAPSDLHEAAHSCGKAYDGCVSPKHLRWATPIENAADKKMHGTVIQGSDHYAAKLTELDVIEIRRIRKSKSLREIADAYGVNISAISKIVNRINWKHI